MYKILFIILFLFITFPAIGAEKGRIEYTPRIDYSLINTKEFEDKAFQYYTIAIQSTIKEEQIKNAELAVGCYRILTSKHPASPKYTLKLAQLYNLMGHDRLAKEFYYKTISLDENYAPGYEGFGDYYYNRKEYRRALKQYNKAYIQNNSIYNVNNKIGTIYQKLGDTQSAVKYLNEAYKINPTEELNVKIRLLEELNSSNALYYKNTRIHFVED